MTLRCSSPALLFLGVAAFIAGCGMNGVPPNSSNRSNPAPMGSGPAPAVTAVAEQTNGVALNRKQEVQFSEAMNPGTINAGTFIVKDAGGNKVAGTVTYDPSFNLAVFQPDPPLEADAKYAATVTTGVQSSGGVNLAAAYTYSFTTRATTDTSPIGVLSTDPANGATCVSQTAPILINFTEEPDAGTITPQSVTLTGPGGTVATTMSLNVATTQLVVKPSAPLQQNTSYVVTVTTGVADLADVPLAAAVTFTFNTGPCAGGGGSGTTYLYAEEPGIPALRGYQVNVTAADLIEVPGSPFHETGTGPGALLVNKNFVYATSTNQTTLGGAPFPAGTSTIWVYRADPASGTLTQIQTLTASGDQAGLLLDPTGHDIYALGLTGVSDTLTINSDGTLKSTGLQFQIPAGPIEGIALSPNGTTGYATVVTGPIAGCEVELCPTNDATWEINRNPTSSALTANHQVGTNLHLSNMTFDASGNHLLGQIDEGASVDEIGVYTVNSSNGSLTAAPGSPFNTPRGLTTPGDDIRAFALDPSGAFVYTLSFGGVNFQWEYVTAFSLNPLTGGLTPVQTFDMTPGDPTSLAVDRSLVYAVNWPINRLPAPGSTPSSINVFRRNETSGMLSPGGSPTILPDQQGLQSAAVMHIQ